MSDAAREEGMMRKQCKDISDKPILQFLKLLEEGKIASCYTTAGDLEVWYPTSATIYEGFANSILCAVPYGVDYPEKLRVKKIHSMVRRGLIDGCLCGCRGDFELTGKGSELLQTLSTEADV